MRRLLLILAASAVLASPAAAGRGVALDIGKIEVAQTLTPGGGYALPPIGVRNPGDEVTSYRVVVTSVQGQAGRPVPAAWFRFAPRLVTLTPGATRKVHMRLSLPSGADPGDYEALIAAQIVTEGKGAQVGAAAAAKVMFRVESETLLGAWWYEVRAAFSDNAPWTWLLPSLLAAALGAWQLRNRFSFRVERRA
jgi:hypothetical protein